MDRLLRALQKANSLPQPDMMDSERPPTPEEEEINSLACELFITSGGDLNRAQVSEFERYAPCKIFCAESDSFGWLMGGINYHGRKYYFG